MTSCFGKELFIRFTVRVFRDRLSMCVCVCFFPFWFWGGMWDLIIFLLDHCLSFYLLKDEVVNQYGGTFA